MTGPAEPRGQVPAPSTPGGSACRSCRAPVLWAVTVQGNRMPLDAVPTSDGNVTLTGRHVATDRGAAPECRVESPGALPLFDDGVDRFMPHHATCPHGEDWRR